MYNPHLQVNRNSLFLWAAVLALLIFPAFALAGPVVQPIITGDPKTDAAVAQLSQIDSRDDFGQSLINWIAYGSPAGKGDSPSLLSHLANNLTMISLFMMAALLAFGGTNFLIHTANKGIPGGQIISSFWMPIRIAVASILLIPAPGGQGYSTLHLGVIKIAEMGSAHAGVLAGEALDYIGTKGIYQPPMIQNGNPVVHGLIQSELCKQYVNSAENKTDANGVYLNTAAGQLNYSKHKGKATFSLGKNIPHYCGSVRYEMPAFTESNASVWTPASTHTNVEKTLNASDWRAKLHKDVFNYTAKTIQPKAAALAAKLLTDQSAFEAVNSDPGSANSKGYDAARDKAEAASDAVGVEMAALVSEYNNSVHSMVVGAINAATTGQSGENWTKEIKDAGWPAFGMIFWHASKMQQEINEVLVSLRPSVTEPLAEATGSYADDERMRLLRARISSANQTSMNAQIEAGKTPDLESLITAGDFSGEGRASVQTRVKVFVNDYVKSFVIPTSEDANMVTRLQSTGIYILAASESYIWSRIVGVSAIRGLQETSERMADAVETAGNAFPKWMGGGFLGAATKTATSGLRGFIIFFASLAHETISYLSFLLMPILLAGFLLGIILPTIPAMFWLLGVISYMLFFVQCLLVSTFWLAAHGTAEGQGWGNEHTRQGYLLMLGLYLSPILRVAGFAAMMVLLLPVGVLAQWMMNYLISIANFSPLTWVAVLVITAIFGYSAAVRIFSLPSELFEDGLRWINGGKEVTGDSGAEQQSRTMIAHFSSHTAGGEQMHGQRHHRYPGDRNFSPTNQPTSPNTV